MPHDEGNGCRRSETGRRRKSGDTVKALVNAGIPVHGHLGLTPQSVNKFGGYGIRAKEEAEAQKLISDAIALDEAGCFAIVLEKVPAKLAAEVKQEGEGCNDWNRCW